MTALDEKFNALEGDVEYIVPTDWNPGHVAYRLIKAFEVLRSLPGAIGPQFNSNSWPIMLQEFAEFGDEEAKMWARDAFAANVRPRFTSEDIARSAEALGWCMVHLGDHPQRADAAQVWAFCKATGYSINKFLRERAKRAAVTARLATQRENALREKKRRAIMADILNGVNRAMAHVPVHLHVDLRNAAIVEFRDRAAGLEPVLIAAHEVCPGRILTRTTLDRHLQPALQALSNRLTATRTPCR